MEADHTDEAPPVDRLRNALPEASRGLVPPVVALAVDTGVMLNNIARDVRDAPRGTHLPRLAEAGIIRLYAGEHVYQEVEEHLPRFMEEQGVDVEAARGIWRGQYLRLMRFVDSRELVPDDPRLRQLAERDPDDLPTAALACALGIQALSEDPDLVDYGLATGRPWLGLVFATENSFLGQSVTAGVAVGVNFSGVAVLEGARGVTAMARDPNGRWILMAVGLLVIGLVIVCVVHDPTRRWVGDHAKGVIASVKDGGGKAYTGYVGISLAWAEGRATIEAAVVRGKYASPHAILVSRMLATTPTPMSTRDVAGRLGNYERVPREFRMWTRQLLERHGAFVEVAEDRWQLGRRLGPAR